MHNLLIPGLAEGSQKIFKFIQSLEEIGVFASGLGHSLQDLIVFSGTLFNIILYRPLFCFIIGKNHFQHGQLLIVEIGPKFDEICHHFNFFLDYRFVAILDRSNPPISHDDHQSQ